MTLPLARRGAQINNYHHKCKGRQAPSWSSGRVQGRVTDEALDSLSDGESGGGSRRMARLPSTQKDSS
ncbi:hypothetical protein E2C01_026414 [Portunus trituberculatus]|uniref:Uncharacterized protein n=1 Tax=Portunus trituberculatus TaxID=210409 RepID=A0A5B7EKW2_PORTR|nr:hypothetical protein [Portunus trituberculatus]